MPLPPKLSKKAPKAKKKARAASVMHELAHGPVNSPARKATSGKQRQKQNVAIMLQNSGQGKKKAKKK
jgi:hypothetical protein